MAAGAAGAALALPYALALAAALSTESPFIMIDSIAVRILPAQHRRQFSGRRCESWTPHGMRAGACFKVVLSTTVSRCPSSLVHAGSGRRHGAPATRSGRVRACAAAGGRRRRAQRAERAVRL